MKKLLSLALKILISGALLVYLFYFSDIVDIEEVASTLRETRLSIFMCVLLIGIGNVLITSKRWSLFLPEEIQYSRAVSLYLIGYFFSTFLPGRIGGDIIKSYYVYRDTGVGGVSVLSVVIDRYLGLGAIIGISLGACAGGYSYFKGSDIVWFVPAVCIVFLMASFLFWKMNWGKIRGLNALYIHLSEYKKKKRFIYQGFALSLLVQAMCILEVYLLSIAIGLKVPIIYFLIFVPVINALTAIPVTVAGLGVREVSFTTLFHMFFSELGVTSSQAVSLSLLTFATMVAINLLGGIEYFRIRALTEKDS